MFGLIVFFAIGLYLALSVFAVWFATRWAKRRNRSPWGWGMLVAFVMYNLVFWDWIPTVVAHNYYCEKEAGFTVYKTLEQWKMENPGVLEGLVDNSPNDYPNWPSETWNGKRIASINQRFGMLYKNHLSNSVEGKIFLNVWRWETEMVDKKTGDVLARQINFSSGNDGYIGGMHSMRLWLVSEGCIEGENHSKNFGAFLKQFRGAKK